jgi:hypothetical protein
MNTINLPPWLQTALTLAGALSLLVPVALRVTGQADKPWARTVLVVANDVLGLKKKVDGDAVR